MNPIEGAREEGNLGLLKGFGRGTVDLLVRSSAGSLFQRFFLFQGHGLFLHML